MSLTIPWSFGNVQRTDAPGTRHQTINEILDFGRGGIAGFNEADKDQAYIRRAAHARGMSVHGRGENAIAYDDRFDVIAAYNFPIMRGGYVGADEVKTAKRGDDDRRLGPSRYLLVLVLWDPTTRQAFVVWCWHLIAKAGRMRWRRLPLFRSIARAGKALAQIVDDVGHAIGMGDTNWSPRFDIPGISEVTVPTPRTHGRSFIDKIHRVGSTVVAGVAAYVTRSDHKGLRGKVTFAGPPTERPTVRLDRNGTPVVAQGAITVPGNDRRPVRHPWARRYNRRRWRIRHPRLWRAIKRWRRAHPRR